MSIPGVTQARVFAPSRVVAGDGGNVSANKTTSWTLPVWIIPTPSFSVMQGLGNNCNNAVLHSRIADRLGIRNGDQVEFALTELEDCRFRLPVTVRSSITADFMIHDAIRAGIAARVQISSICTLTLRDGRDITLLNQELWAGMKMIHLQGEGILQFDGASRNNPSGPAGFGFSVASKNGDHLVKGYCYCGAGSSNEMEYAGLLEGLHWALRFDFEKLVVRGDSELVIRQLQDEYAVNEERLKTYHIKIKGLLEESETMGTEVVLEHVPREKNIVCDTLANLALDLKENATACNWKNINLQCERDAFR